MKTQVSLSEFLGRANICGPSGLYPGLEGATPFVPNYAQRCVIRRVEYAAVNKRPLRLLLLRDRQVGQSTICLGIMAWLAETTGVPVSVVTHAVVALDHYRQTLKGFLPDVVPVRRSEVGGVLLSTAKHLEVGRGRTLQGAYLSDVDYFSSGEDVLVSTLQAIPLLPGTIVIVSAILREKTPAWFLKTWERAEGYGCFTSEWDRLYLGREEE